MRDGDHRFITRDVAVPYVLRDFKCPKTGEMLASPDPEEMRYCPFCGDKLGGKDEQGEDPDRAGPARIELALADLVILHHDGETTIDGVDIDVLEGGKELLEIGYEARQEIVNDRKVPSTEIKDWSKKLDEPHPAFSVPHRPERQHYDDLTDDEEGEQPGGDGSG